MHDVPMPLVRRALRRSRVRVAVLLALAQLPNATMADLVRLCGGEPRWVRGALHGHGGAFRASGALVRMRLVRASVVDGVVVYVLTARGKRVAAALRRDVRRALGARPVARV